ncbi:MAG: hypothetical protein HY044_04135 [Candidatus Woesebacteria bacterium]|nr:MAG: hypothetical protein HY044_04135 [Candidatus Woesebacteria bacterium]
MKQSRLVKRKLEKTKKKPVIRIGKNFAKLKRHLIIFASLFVGLCLIFGFVVNSHRRRIILAIPLSDGGVSVNVFNNRSNSITSFKIPSETLVSASRNLGFWKIKSIWRLGIDEKLYGKLLSETLAKSFYFPVDSWASYEANGFLSGGFGASLSSLFSSYKTNLSFWDKINIFLMSNTSRRDFSDLKETSLLEEAVLPDGDRGFRISNSNIQSEIVSAFADPVLSSKSATVSIFNQGQLANDKIVGVGMLLEMMGAKVIGSFSKGSSDFNCQVEARDKEAAFEFQRILGCSIQIAPDLGDGEFKLYLGRQFVL